MSILPDPKLYFSEGKSFEEYAHPKIVSLWRQEQYVQRTPEWFAKRYTGISASDSAKSLTMGSFSCQLFIDLFNLHDSFKINPKKCCDPYSSTKELILKKCKKSDNGSNLAGNAAIAWGVKYEAVVQTIYSQMCLDDTLEFGLLCHPTIPFILASPDGILAKNPGRMLEIKCPSKRKVGPVPPRIMMVHSRAPSLRQESAVAIDLSEASAKLFLKGVL